MTSPYGQQRDNKNQLIPKSSGGISGSYVISVNGEDGVVVLTAADVGAVPVTREVNGLPLSADITITTGIIPEDSNFNFVSNAELVVIGNTSGVNTGDQTITLTGDVTGSGGGSFATTIANDAVTTVKILNGAVTEAKQTLADNTTHNVSITAHGYAPKAPNDATKYLDGTGAYSVPGGGGGGTVIPGTCEGRITLTTGVPVTTSDVTGAATVYFTPFRGNKVALYSGSAWAYHSLTEMSIAVPATTVTMYDLFLDNNGGTPQLVATAWTNDTTRATALTTQDGVLVKSGDTEQRYLGSFRTASVSGQTEDSAAKRFVYNYYNRAVRLLYRAETADNWSYTTNTWRQARASADNKVELINGIAEDIVGLQVTAIAANSTGTLRAVSVGIGENTTTTPTMGQVGRNFTSNAGVGNAVANLSKIPAVGYSYYAWLERGNGNDAQTWYGDDGASTIIMAGITGNWRC